MEQNQDTWGDVWGKVEQNAFERLQETDVQYIPGEEVLHWISLLQQGDDV
uniref:Uncharacterized protein n=1 Tax=Cyanothece sp. (strain PCC 7425 / ATCC 29141) TaxID=395961 RepID=B8HWC1_CYAP4